MTDSVGEGPEIVNAAGQGAVVLVCEHASNAIPAAFAGLGLAPGDEASHAAWDPGALGVARAMAAALDAPLVAATVSRLVHDCNRPGGSPGAMPPLTETIAIPGNRDLTRADRADRARRYYAPFRDALEAVLAARPGAALVTVHSFTPIWHGVPRAVEIGILHDADARLADAMLVAAPFRTGHVVARNEPYGPQDGVTHTLREHGVGKGRLNVMLEIRNDLIAGDAAQARMGVMLAGLVTAALAGLGQGAAP
ncbi:N-formylglutamate amidohydrolase [Rhodovulum euryhalinum]|uniref:Putative N-formylglutamate amidohydrolase n=1 Tax=Rhodovulum euryhalinum TaxID=35805 RepID=A0A4R2KA74_9RHOB|nr:N-formylglutamate amidohydrolase [Rhodovulum euryhalinum]TCO70361.1 putative N-formylglutamate amidohydrolase [Rhodovulum euryhalinum]